VPVRPSHESAINTELEILKSQEIAEMAVDSIGAEVLAYKEHPVDNSTGKIIAKVKRPMHVLVKRIRQLRVRSGAANESNKRDSTLRMVMDNLRIEKQKMGSTITLSYKSQNPQLAQEVLTKLIDSYLEKHIAVHQTPGSHEFFTQQSAHLHGKLTELEDELQQQRVMLDHISVLENNKNQTEIALAASKATVEALEKTLAEMPDTVVMTITEGFPNVAADGMRQRLYSRLPRQKHY
ncbi:MAG: hypothetical protein ACYSWO_17015, partial [Planctomycetota bacterium]